jgi:hypothetical protein
MASNGFGPGIIDFSPLANLGQTFTRAFDDSRKRQETEEKRAMFRTAAQGGDLNKIGLALLGAGDVQSGAALLGLGQKSADRESDNRVLQSIFGGGSAGAPTAPRPQTQANAASASVGDPTEVESRFVGTVRSAGLTNPIGLAAVAAYGKAESGFSPQNANRVWNDPSESGQPGQAGGIMSWRADRLQNLQRFAQQKGEQPGNISPETQAEFLTKEDPQLLPRLQSARSPEEANQIMANAWRFAGFDRPGGENARRLALTQQYAQRFSGQPGQAQAGQTQVAASIQPVQSGGQLPPPGVQVAENEADVQRIEAQMPGYGGGQPQGAQVASVSGDDPVRLRQEAARYAQSSPEAARQFIARAEAIERGAGTQMAQGQPQPGAPQSDVPAQGAAPAQGFVVPGTGAVIDQQTMASNPRVQNMVRALGLVKSDQARAAINKQLEIEMADIKTRQDQGGPLDRDNKRLQNEKLRRELQGEGAVPLTAEERAQFGVAPDQAAYKTRNGEIKFGPAGAKITNTNTFDGKGESKFNEALGTAQAKRWNGYIEEGDIAQGRIADIQTLREASRRLGSQGSSANLKAMIGPYAESLGIKVEGLGDIQLYESITNRLAPQLRAAGSGSTSDIEFKGFMRAIGPLSNTPAAREMILDTFEAAGRNDLARAEIASRLAEGQISRGQAEKEIRSLPNPLEGFRKYREANPDEVGRALKESALQQAAEKRDPVKVTSPDEARKLPSGTRIILPDGRPGVVP